MNTEKTTSKNLFKTINEYLNLVILLPVLIGGIWQLIKLSSISMSYIRFFSITQLVSDGFLIIIYIALIVLPVFIIGYLLYSYIQYDNSKKELKNSSDLKKNYLVGIFLILTSISVLFIVWHLINTQYYYDVISNILLLLLISLFSFTSLIFWALGWTYCGVSLKTETFRDNGAKVMLSYLGSIIILLVLYCYKTAVEFDKNYAVPEDLQNIEKLIDPAKEELIYYNDTYIFIRDLDTLKGKNKTRVVKFDKLFEE